MTVIGFGGLGDDIGQWLNRGLLEPLRAKYPFVPIIRYSWTDNPAPPPKHPIIVVGHSFGGWRARVWAEQNQADLLLTIDGRTPPFGSYGVTVYKDRDHHLNVWQPGGWFSLCGYPVSAAGNTFITDGTSHVAMPWHPTVHLIMESFINRFEDGHG